MGLPHSLAILLTTIAFAAPAAAATAEDGALNAVYAALSRARAAHDVAGMTGAFGAGGLLVDARPGPAISGAELGERLQPMAARIKAEGVKIETAYRLERRSVMGDVAVDAGYMRQTMVRPDGQKGVRYSRFLVTMRRDPQAGWRIIGDASMPAEQAAFDAVKQAEGLHFDA
ncbi:MAG TPA: nuclear transport factor 2 family protein [Sphingomicrobium sp.]|nr:nuclear transport factor 2 family protein [Sphingomicrobium sp.]